MKIKKYGVDKDYIKSHWIDTGKRYYYRLNITTGFIVGFIIDNIVPCTLGMPMRLLKGFGRIWYSKELKLNKYTNNKYVRGFLN